MTTNNSKKTLHHGGDTNWARQMFKFGGNHWLDLSTGINASPYPLPPISNKASHLLPQVYEIEKLLKLASSYYRVSPQASLVLAPGSQALIQWLPQLRHKGKTVIIGPTYAEHETCWARCGHDVTYANNLDTALAAQPDVIVVVNPNNPTGTIYSPEALLNAIRTLAARNGLLVVDEAFADVTPDISMAPFAGGDGLIILRSFGKFFGLAGIRLGVAITNEKWASMLNDAIGPWAISGITIDIALKAYADKRWIEATAKRLSLDHQRMNCLLKNLDLALVGGCDLFTLVEGCEAQRLFHHLGDNGIMVRHFPVNDQWLRFGFPGNNHDWQRLEATLSKFKN